MADEKAITIGKLLAGTTLTKAMVDDMMLAAVNGEMVRTSFDGEALQVERLEFKDVYETAKLPRAHRPYKATLLAVAELLTSDDYLSMTIDEMVGYVMHATGGAAQPDKVQAIFSRLQDDAGV